MFFCFHVKHSRLCEIENIEIAPKRDSKQEEIPAVETQQIQKPVVDTLGLPPLDEIRIPDLTRDGYSIHSYVDGDEFGGDPSLSY